MRIMWRIILLVYIMKNAIVVLTRGYSNLKDYQTLVNRNRHIEHCLQDKNIDILIFHEGNIFHQVEIQRASPSLKLIFIDIKKHNLAFKKEYESIPVDPATANFNLGYRHMCSFWFVDFWHFVKEYDSILRIDEDCYIRFPPDKVFDSLKKYAIVTGKYENDDAFVTKGLNDCTRKFIMEHKYEILTKKTPGGPYTNLCGLSLEPLRRNSLLGEYIQTVKDSNMIYKQRWGDLPLWGESIHYILGDDSLLIDTTLKYFHGSHNKCVN